MDDYYELVGVERTASREDIDRKIREQLRLWQRRTANADLERRQAAERRVQQLGQARITLLDEAKRRRYDRQLTASLAGEPPPTSATGATTASGNGAGGGADTTVAGTLLNQARSFLAANDHQAALYAARETLRASPNPPPETWTILARANSELGRLDDALFEARRAVAADPQNPESHLALARVHERRQEWADASRAYEAAIRLDPRAETPHIGIAKALARAGKAASALDRLERRFTQTADRQRGGRLLARGLVETAQVVLRPPGGRQVRHTTELATVQRMLDRARQVTSDAELLRRISALDQELVRARARAAGAPGAPRYDPLRRNPGPVPHPPPPGRRTNVLAVVALVLALTCLTAPVGAILGHLARTQIRERGEQGDGKALAAIIVGWLVTALFCCGGLAIYANT